MATVELAPPSDPSGGEPMTDNEAQQPVVTTPDPLQSAPDWSCDCATVWRHPGNILEVTFVPGCALDSTLLNEVARGAESIIEHTPVHVLVDISSLVRVDPPAATAFSTYDGLGRVAILGFGPADRVLARFFMTATTSEATAEMSYFEERSAAFAYLGGHG